VVIVPRRPILVQNTIEQALLHKSIKTGRQCRARDPQNSVEVVEFSYSGKREPENKKAPPVSDRRKRAADRGGPAGGI